MRHFLAGALILAATAVYGQDYPNKPIRMLVPFAPGGAVDTTARVLAQAMQQRLNWQFVVENRPGGNGFIATTAVQKAPPDGYTLLMAHTGEFAVNPALFPDVPYDLERDFLPITMVSDAPMLYLAKAQAPFNNFKELIAAAKAKPDTITFGSVIDRVNKEVRETLKVPEVQKKFVESAGAEAIGMTPEEFLARIKSDAERYKRVVQKAAIKPG